MTMKESEKIDAYYALSPRKYTVVESLVLRQDFDIDDVMRQSISIVMKTTLDYPSQEALDLDFFSVRNLIIKQPDLSLISIPHIEIMLGNDVPGCAERFYVRDPSQDQIIRFSCENFRFHTK